MTIEYWQTKVRLRFTAALLTSCALTFITARASGQSSAWVRGVSPEAT
jgi:hypothetical protein